MSSFKKYIIRKIIPFISVLGSLTGFAVCMMHIFNKDINVVTSSIYMAAFLMAGIILSVALDVIYNLKGKDILTYNYLGKPTFFQQKIYILGLIGVVVGFFIGFSVSVGFAIICALMFGASFTIGLGIGIFDYQDVVTKKLLGGMIVPIVGSFVYAYYATDVQVFTDLVWVSGSVFLYSYLLFVNRIRLNSIIFFRNSVNIENSKSIRVFNDILISGFFVVFLLFFNVKKFIEFGYQWILSGFMFLINLMMKLMDGLLSAVEIPRMEQPADVGQFFAGESVPMSTFTKIMIFTFAAIFGIGMIFVLYTGVRILLRAIKKAMDGVSGSGNKKKDKKVTTKEYEEESEIIVNKFKRQKGQKEDKYLYSLKGLEKLESDEEKLRYLYGYALERLQLKHVDIRRSDTPIQILDKISENKGGIELNDEQFERFTEQYRRVRYGYKQTEKIDFTEQAKILDKKISDLKVKIKRD